MPGPGPHTMYALGSGLALMNLSNGRFSPQHCIIYAINAFLGPDLGSFSEWLTSTLVGLLEFVFKEVFLIPFLGVSALGHHPTAFLGSINSENKFGTALGESYENKGVWDQVTEAIERTKGGLWGGSVISYLKENGHSSMYLWILSTGWWKGRAPVNPDSVVVVGFLCTSLVGGFIYINRVKDIKSIKMRTRQSLKLILIIASLYCLWCACQKYWRNPPQPAIGEEADLGVIAFLAVYFFLPHSLCIISMNSKYFYDATQEVGLLQSSPV
ncbi:hypothetical protein IFM89_030233 [Coptis chinensis]|uniref:Uncharacterized protein n=1 Tax=Coptis chinensis TaxID=261450 RepID=A0A835HTZ7_9MAGN|nr:hypothetical protein IFM89_030233 [Coptis chinensis]